MPVLTAPLCREESIQLDRHYVYPYCSPTRASFHTGRLPYHVNQIKCALSRGRCSSFACLFLTVARCSIGSYLPGAGVARNMTMIPRKLKQAGYSTHMIGKVSDPCPLALRRDLAPPSGSVGCGC